MELRRDKIEEIVLDSVNEFNKMTEVQFLFGKDIERLYWQQIYIQDHLVIVEQWSCIVSSQ